MRKYKRTFNAICNSICTPSGYTSWLRPAVLEAAAADDFTGRLLGIADRVFEKVSDGSGTLL